MAEIPKKKRKLDAALREAIGGGKSQVQKSKSKEKLKLALQSDDRSCNSILLSLDANGKQQSILDCVLELLPEMKETATISLPFINLFSSYFATLGVDSTLETFGHILASASKCVEVAYAKNAVIILRLLINSLNVSGAVFKRIIEQALIDFKSLTDDLWTCGEKVESLQTIHTLINALCIAEKYSLKVDSSAADVFEEMIKDKRSLPEAALLSLVYQKNVEKWATKLLDATENFDSVLALTIIKDNFTRLVHRLNIGQLAKIIRVLLQRSDETESIVESLKRVSSPSGKLEIAVLAALLDIHGTSETITATREFLCSEDSYKQKATIAFLNSNFDEKIEDINSESISSTVELLEKLVLANFFDFQRIPQILISILCLKTSNEAFARLFYLILRKKNAKVHQELLIRIGEGRNAKTMKRRFDRLVNSVGTNWTQETKLISFLTAGEWINSDISKSNLKSSSILLNIAKDYHQAFGTAPEIDWQKKVAFPTLKKLIKKLATGGNDEMIINALDLLGWLNRNNVAVENGLDSEVVEIAKTVVLAALDSGENAEVIGSGVEMILMMSTTEDKASLRESLLAPTRLLNIGKYAQASIPFIVREKSEEIIRILEVISEPSFLTQQNATDVLLSVLTNSSAIKNHCSQLLKNFVQIVKSLQGTSLKEVEVLTRIVEIYGGSEQESVITQLCLASHVAHGWAERETTSKNWSEMIVTTSRFLETVWKCAKNATTKSCATIYSTQVSHLLKNSQNFIRLHQEKPEAKGDVYRVLENMTRLVDYMKNAEKQFAYLAGPMIADSVFFGSFTLLPIAKMHNFAEKNVPAMLSTNLQQVERIRYKKILPIIQKSQKKVY